MATILGTILGAALIHLHNPDKLRNGAQRTRMSANLDFPMENQKSKEVGHKLDQMISVWNNFKIFRSTVNKEVESFSATTLCNHVEGAGERATP